MHLHPDGKEPVFGAMVYADWIRLDDISLCFNFSILIFLCMCVLSAFMCIHAASTVQKRPSNPLEPVTNSCEPLWDLNLGPM